MNDLHKNSLCLYFMYEDQYPKCFQHCLNPEKSAITSVTAHVIAYPVKNIISVLPSFSVFFFCRNHGNTTDTLIYCALLDR